MDVVLGLNLATSAISKLTSSLNRNQQNYVDFGGYSVTSEGILNKRTNIKYSYLSTILGLVIGLYAAYLSWQCNSKVQHNIFLKVIFSIFAFFFGLVYLILYLLMRWDVCRKL